MIWKDHSRGSLTRMALFEGAMYTILGAVLLLSLVYFEVGRRFWLPVILIYITGVIVQVITYGIGAINIQIDVSTENRARDITDAIIQLRDRLISIEARTIDLRETLSEALYDIEKQLTISNEKL